VKPLTEGRHLCCQQKDVSGTTETMQTVHNSVRFAPLDLLTHMAKHHPAAKDDQKENSKFLRKEATGELTCCYVF